MYVHSIILQNYKCFSGESKPIQFKVPDKLTCGSGLNILVGENNSGKSTVFEAFDFVRNGLPRGKSISDLRNKGANETDRVAVDIVFGGDIKEVVDHFAQKNKQAVLRKYVYDEEGKKGFRISRSSDSPKEILLWNHEEGGFRNEAGIDAPIKKLFELDFVWADTNPSDETKFGATTICGKLLREISKSFSETEEFKQFQESFRIAFNSEKSSLRTQLKEIEQRTQEVFQSQFGKARITFHFDDLQIADFFKSIRIKVDDGIETYLEEKGTGMQRSVAFALLQVYAESLVKHPTSDSTKPFFLFVDEPEICLHPQAQYRLLRALEEIAKTQQVFVVTHSSHFMKPSLMADVIRFRLDTDLSVVVNSLTNSQLIEDVKKRENRSFFLRHRNLLFTDVAIFVEGVDDQEKYNMFCEHQGFEHLSEHFFMMNGCSPVFFFADFCAAFGIVPVAIVDRDFSFERPFWANKERQKVIQRMRELCTDKGIPFDYVSIEKAVAETGDWKPRGGKWEIEEIKVDGVSIHKVKERNIFVLRHGEVNDYLDSVGESITKANDEKSRELKAIFSEINRVVTEVSRAANTRRKLQRHDANNTMVETV